MPQPNQSTLDTYACSPMAFVGDLVIPSAHGPQRFRDVMAGFQRERFLALEPSLLAVAASQKPKMRRFWWEASKGGAKDSDVAIALLWLMVFSPRPLLIQIGAADQRQAAEARKAAQDILRLNPWLGGLVTVNNWELVAFDEQRKPFSTCEILAADNTTRHGSRPDVVLVNELSHIRKQEFAETLVDNAAKVPQGLVIIATNAGHTNTWQWRWRELARKSERWSFHRLAEPSPWLDAADLEEARIRNSAARYARLFWSVWSAGGGDALDSESIEQSIIHDGPLSGYEQDYVFSAGLDLGIKHDHSALVVVGRHVLTGRRRLAWCEAWAPPKGGEVDIDEIEQAAIAANQRFHFRWFLYDPSQAIYLAQRLGKSGIKMDEVPFVGKALDRMAVLLLSQFRSRNVELYRDHRLIRDLGRLVIVEKSYGHKLESVSDEHGHADTATAFLLALIGSEDATPAREPQETWTAGAFE